MSPSCPAARGRANRANGPVARVSPKRRPGAPRRLVSEPVDAVLRDTFQSGRLVLGSSAPDTDSAVPRARRGTSVVAPQPTSLRIPTSTAATLALLTGEITVGASQRASQRASASSPEPSSIRTCAETAALGLLVKLPCC